MIKIFSYSKNKLEEIEKDNIPKKGTIWIELFCPTKDEINLIKEKFDIHPTTEEDILSNNTRTKYEEFEDNTLVIFKTIKQVKELEIQISNISFIIGENYLITTHMDKNENIEHLLENKKKLESLMKKGKDNIFHHILDKEIDLCMNLKTNVFEDFKKIEKKFIQNPEKEVLEELFQKELIILEMRQVMESLNDVCLNLTKPTDNYLSNELLPYFRDVYDHSFKITESFKGMLGRINGMRNSYQSIISNKLNETMKILTLIMAIMMPITIITGFYGMNVKLPFQNNIHAWIGIFSLIAGVSIIMYFIFRKLKIK